MGSAGVVANGVNAGAINFVQIQFFDENPINNIIDFTFSSKVSLDNPDSVDITVSTKALADIPEGVKLHIIISENLANWANVWPEGVNDTGAVENGQTIVTDLALDIIGDTLGNDFPQIASGESHSMTHSFVIDANHHNKDNLEVTAILQVTETKKILAFARDNKSPFSSTSAIIGNHSFSKANNFIAKVKNNNVVFNVPYRNMTATLFNSIGQKITTIDIHDKLGKEEIIPITFSSGILFLMVRSEQGETLTTKFMLNQ